MLKVLVWILLTLLYLLPILYFILSLSFLSFDYLKLLFSFSDIKLLFYSLLYASFIGLISTCLGFFLSLILVFSNIKYKKCFLLAFLLPMLIPSYTFVFAWMGFLGKRGTFLPLIFPNIPLDIYNPQSFILFSALSYFPFSLIFSLIGLISLDERLINAARIANKSKLKIIRKIILPLTLPYLLISFLFSFGFSLSEFTVPSFLRVNTYQLKIFTQLATFYDIRKASVYSFPLLLISFFLMLAFFKKMKHIGLTQLSLKHAPLIKSNKFTYFILVLFLFISIGAPLIMLLLESEGTFFLAIVNAKAQIFNSIIFCSLASAACTFLAFVFTILYEEKSLMVMLTLFLPSPILALVILNFYSQITSNYMFMMLLGYIARYLPFSILILLASFSQISKNIKESVRLLNKSTYEKIFKFYLPLHAKALTVSFLFVLVLSMMEVNLPQMLSPPGFQTLSLRIETLMHYADYAQVSSLSLFLIFFFLIMYSIGGMVYASKD